MGKMVGIDLGTTNSVVAIVDGPQARVLDNKDAKSQTRSAVSLKKRKGKSGGTEEVLVGDTALENWPMAPRDTVISIKRLMGRAAGDPEVQHVRQWAQYKIIEPTDGTKDSVRVVVGGKEYSPIDLSAMILRKLKEDAEFRLGDTITHAVITVPAYFSERQRDATRKAGLKAGMRVMKILDEPTAAAIAFGVDAGDSGEPKTILVYDLGGGTFDISVLMWAGNVFAPLNLEGDMWLGGDNFDQVLVDHVLKHVKEEYSIDGTKNDRFMAQLRKSAQATKERLSNARSADLTVPGLLTDESGDLIDVQLEITREEYERMIQPLVARTVQITEKALKNAGYTAEQIDYVLMAGNSTCLPMVQAAMEKMFKPEKVLRKIHPKHCVAIGAALLAARLRGVVCQAPDKLDPKQPCGKVNKPDANICEQCGASLQLEEEQAGASGSAETTVIPDIVLPGGGIAAFSYGAQTAGDKFNVFIRKSEPYPTENPQALTFYTTMPNQRIISIPVYGGDHLDKASANELQGQAFAILPPHLPQDTPVRIKIWLDNDGIFELSSHLEDGTNMHPWILRGEEDSRAAEALEVAERKLAQKGESIPPERRRDLDRARERVFDELRKKDNEQARQHAENLDEMIDQMAVSADKADLRTQAENLIGFGEFVLHRFGWAFDPNQAYKLNNLVEDTRKAMDSGNPALLEQKVDALDKATDGDALPEIVRVFVQLGSVIANRIQPYDPALSGKLIQEMEEVERAVKANDASAKQKFEGFVQRVVDTIKKLEGARPQAPKCSVCQADVVPGERYCPNRHDTWILKDKSTTSGRSF
jgi:molecular chaperone DnaK